MADINNAAKQTNNGIDISAENLAYLDENEPDEDLRKHINSLEDEILISAIDESGEKKAVGVGYFLDALGNKHLKKGDVIYQLSRPSGTDSPYFTDKKTVDMCRGKDGEVDLEKLKKVLQIEDKDNSKTLLTEYTLTEDVRLSGGQCVVNFKHGDGSGNQYVLRADSNEARLELKARIMNTTENSDKGDSTMASNSFQDRLAELNSLSSPEMERTKELVDQHHEKQSFRDSLQKASSQGKIADTQKKPSESKSHSKTKSYSNGH